MLDVALSCAPGRLGEFPERRGQKIACKAAPTERTALACGSKRYWGSVAITEAEIEAARKGGAMVRQGTFSGPHEVKA